MREVTTIGIDIAKNIFQLHLADKQGKKIDSKRLSRDKLISFLANIPPCLIGMESCGSSYFWARQIEKSGHHVKLMAPQLVKPYVKSNKNDQNNAEAIAEAVRRPTMRFVPIKNIAQQDIQSLHRVREGAIKHKIFMSNQLRGLLAEYGIVFPQGNYALKTKFMTIIEDSNNELSELSRELFIDLFIQFKQADEKVKEYEKKIVLAAKENEQCQRVMKIEGVGPLIATAMVAAVGNARDFKNGREMAAWLGLVPKHIASGEKKTSTWNNQTRR